jgi:hypothetical protein
VTSERWLCLNWKISPQVSPGAKGTPPRPSRSKLYSGVDNSTYSTTIFGELKKLVEALQARYVARWIKLKLTVKKQIRLIQKRGDILLECCLHDLSYRITKMLWTGVMKGAVTQITSFRDIVFVNIHTHSNLCVTRKSNINRFSVQQQPHSMCFHNAYGCTSMLLCM